MPKDIADLARMYGLESEEDRSEVEALAIANGLIDELARRRARLDLTQARVAARMGTNQATVAKLESHRHDPRLSTLARYIAAIKLPAKDVAAILIELGLDEDDGPTTDGSSRSVDMATSNPVFIYIGTYATEAAARDDYVVVQDLHTAGAVGTYDSAVIAKDDDGTVQVSKGGMATGHGPWGGAAVGGLIGLLFPQTILVGAAAGAAVGGVSGLLLWKSLSRSDVKELGDLIDAGEAALLIVGESTLQQSLCKAELKAEMHVELDLSEEPPPLLDTIKRVGGDNPLLLDSPGPGVHSATDPNQLYPELQEYLREK